MRQSLLRFSMLVPRFVGHGKPRNEIGNGRAVLMVHSFTGPTFVIVRKMS